MVWWTEFATPGQVLELNAVGDPKRVLTAYGPLLRSVRVPTSREGRAVCFVAAYWDEDSDRQQAILDGDGRTFAQVRTERLGDDTDTPDTDPDAEPARKRQTAA